MTGSDQQPPRPDMRNPVHFLAFGFGSGLAPRAPGTAGTLVALPLWWLASQGGPLLYIAVTVVVIAVGPFLCGRTSRDLGVHDHGGIVWDEIAGFLLAMTAVPVDWRWMIAGFLLFRIFDILKPWPIGWLDRHIHGGIGIMIDDLVAAAYAAAILQFALHGWPALA